MLSCCLTGTVCRIGYPFRISASGMTSLLMCHLALPMPPSGKLFSISLCSLYRSFSTSQPRQLLMFVCMSTQTNFSVYSWMSNDHLFTIVFFFWFRRKFTSGLWSQYSVVGAPKINTLKCLHASYTTQASFTSVLQLI